MDFQQMPIGFAMALAQNSAAMEAYAALSPPSVCKRPVRRLIPTYICKHSAGNMSTINWLIRWNSMLCTK